MNAISLFSDKTSYSDNNKTITLFIFHIPKCTKENSELKAAKN